MIMPRKHIIITPFLMSYIDYLLKRHFRDIKVIGNEVPPEVPLLAVGNHISWWDGFFVLYLARKYLKRNLYVMMLEEQLLANPILKYGGAFSIKRGSKDIINSLNFAVEKLDQKDNIVLIYPQGKLNSIYCDTFVFEKGIEYIVNAKYKNYQPKLLFVACLIEYGSYKKPTVFIHYRLYEMKPMNAQEIAYEYSLFYKQCVNYNINYYNQS